MELLDLGRSNITKKIMKKTDKFKVKGSYTYTVYKDGKVIRKSPEIENLVLLNNNPSGLYILMSHLLGTDTNGLEITGASIGTGTTTPTISDTSLETPVLTNIPIAQKAREADDEISFVFFVNDKELANEDYTEFGLEVGDYLFTRSLIEPTFTKSEGEDFRLDYNIKIIT